MILRIKTTLRRKSTILALSGRIEAEHMLGLEEPSKPQTNCRRMVVDRKEMDQVDRGAVNFRARGENGGVKFENCPTCIRVWIQREKRVEGGSYWAVTLEIRRSGGSMGARRRQDRNIPVGEALLKHQRRGGMSCSRKEG